MSRLGTVALPIGLAVAALLAQARTARADGGATLAVDAGATTTPDADATSALDAADAGAPALSTGPDVARPAQAHLIHIGVYLLHIHDIDLKAGTATVTYYVWTRWRAPDIDGTAYELVNGEVESKEHEYRYEENGERYAYYRCRAVVQVEADFRSFPFDEHELVLAFEHRDNDADFVVFAVDRDGVRYPSAPRVSGWAVDPPRFDVVPHAYRTNWGAPHISPDDSATYSRFRVRSKIAHAAGATFTKTFLALFISALITALAFTIDPADLGSRIGVGVAGTFGAVTSYALVSGSLPEVSYVTLADKVHVAVLGFVFFVLLESCFAGHLARTERVSTARRVDRWAGPASGVVLLVGVVALIVGR